MLDNKLSRDEGIPYWRHCWTKHAIISELEGHRKKARGCRGYYRAGEADLERAENRDQIPLFAADIEGRTFPGGFDVGLA